MKATSKIFTVDIEEYFHADNLACSLKEENIKNLPDRIDIGLNKLLGLLEKSGNRATFFVLGCLAEKHKDLIKEIDSHGHEIASHGYTHLSLHKHTPLSFAQDLAKSLKVLSDIAGRRIIGYRAPNFSLPQGFSWFFEALKKEGIIYDSSISCSLFRACPADEFLNKRGYFEIGSGILEFPLSFIKIGPFKTPLGGGYFRFYPYWLIRRGLSADAHSGAAPEIFYIHPWELDVGQPKFRLPAIRHFRHYLNLGHTEEKLKRLLADFNFISIRDFLNDKGEV